jgi:hypothetical protein
MRLRLNLLEAEDDIARLSELLEELYTEKFVLEDLSSDFSKPEFQEMYNYFINNRTALNVLFDKFLVNKGERDRLNNSNVLVKYSAELLEAMNNSKGDVASWEADLELLAKNVSCLYNGKSTTLAELQSMVDNSREEI